MSLFPSSTFFSLTPTKREGRKRKIRPSRTRADLLLSVLALIAAIKREDPNPNAINRNPDPNHPINRLGKQLREKIDSLGDYITDHLFTTEEKKAFKQFAGNMIVVIPNDRMRMSSQICASSCATLGFWGQM